MTDQQHSAQPWWKEPWPWIIMAGPFIALVGCAITIALAVKHYGDQGIADGAVRQGLVVKRVGPDTAEAVSPPAAGVGADGRPVTGAAS